MSEISDRISAICDAFPHVTQRLSHGAPTWFYKDRKSFITCWHEGHHDHTFPHLWCAALPGAQGARIAEDPEVFFRPPYVGHRGWIGVRLDGDVDWAQIAEVCEEAYRAVAPR